MILHAVSAGSLDTSVRTEVERTFADELAAPGRPSHLELFDRFADRLSAPTGPASPATKRLVDVLTELAESSTAEGLAGLSVYELQSPEVSATKASGLRCRYGLDGTAVAFWDTHAETDVDHASWLLQALARTGADEELVSTAAAAAAGAWWNFLGRA